MSREMKYSGIPWIGNIPCTWDVKRIKTIFKERTELSENGSETLLSVSEYYGVANRSEKVADGEIVSRAESLVGYKKCYQGDLVSNIMLAWKGSMGITDLDGIVSPAYCVYQPSNKIFPKYYHYLFRTSLYTSIFRLYSKGIIDSRLRLYSPYFFDIKALIPTKAEQQKIAEFLDRKCSEIDEMVALQEKVIEELKVYKQSVITEAVTKGLNPDAPKRDSGIEWIGQIPEHWEVKRLKNIFRLKTGTTPDGFDVVNEDSEIIPWFTPSDISDECCELHQSERKLYKSEVGEIELFPKGSLMFVGIGASAGKLGYSHILGCSNQQITALIPDNCNGKYYYYFLIADRKRLRDNAFFTTLPIINNGYLSQNKIVYPPISEQQAIADYLDEKCADIDSLIQTKQEKIDSLKEYKKSIIYEYITGKKEI